MDFALYHKYAVDVAGFKCCVFESDSETPKEYQNAETCKLTLTAPYPPYSRWMFNIAGIGWSEAPVIPRPDEEPI